LAIAWLHWSTAGTIVTRSSAAILASSAAGKFETPIA
jgi:hypothetical protein